MKESQHLRFVRSELNKGSKGPGTYGRMDALAGSEYLSKPDYPISDDRRPMVLPSNTFTGLPTM